MIYLKTPPQAPNQAKEEYNIDFEKLDKGFSILENVQPTLKITDGNNSQLDSVVLKKRQGTEIINDYTTELGNISSQFLFQDSNGEYTHIISNGYEFINHSSAPLNITSDISICNIKPKYATTSSYTGDVLFSGTNRPSIRGSWTSVNYDFNTDMSTLTTTGKDWEEGELIGRIVVLDINSESIVYDIEENDANSIKVRGDVVGVTAVTTAILNTTSTSVAVDSTIGLATGGGELQIGNTGDYIYYTVIQGNVIDGITGVSINYPIGTEINSGVKRAFVGGEFKIEHLTSSDKILDTSKTFKTGGIGELTGKIVLITSGTGKGQSRTIISNTKDTINVNLPFSPVLDSSSNYKIYAEKGQVLFISNGMNKLLKYSGGNLINEINAPSGESIDIFGGRLFIGNASIVNDGEIGVTVSSFTSLGATTIVIENVEGLKTTGTFKVSYNGERYSATYTGIDIPNKTLTGVVGLISNIEKGDHISFQHKTLEGTVTSATQSGAIVTINITDKEFTIDELKGKYILFTSGTGSGGGQLAVEILSNTATSLSINASNIGNIPDSSTKYQISTKNKHSVYYSEVDDYENFNISTRFITPPGADEITGIKQWNDRLVIFKRNSIWSVIFTYNSLLGTWQPKLDRIPADTGCINGDSIVQVEDQLWFFDGRQYKSVGFSDTQIGVLKTDSVSFPINNMFKNIAVGDDLTITSGYFNNLFYFSPKHKDITNKTVYIYNYKYSTWLIYTGLDIGSFAINDNLELFIGGRYNGKLNVFKDDIYSDEGVPIKSLIETRNIDLGNNHLYKRFRDAAFVFENMKAYAEISITINTSGELRRVGELVQIGAQETGGLGYQSFGNGGFGSGEGQNINNKILTAFKKVISKRGISIKLSVLNNRDEQLSLGGLSFTYSGLKEQAFSNKFIY